MPIDFRDPCNREAYASREASEVWGRAIKRLTAPHGVTVSDIDCGGKICSLARNALEARQVVDVAFSAQVVSTAAERIQGPDGIAFNQGDAKHIGLPGAEFDVVFRWGLIHDLASYEPCFTEARRPMKAVGILIVQDRTEQDVGQPASPGHPRGYFFEKFLQLNAFEARLRPSTPAVTEALQAAGFAQSKVETLWEMRRRYDSSIATKDLKTRSGRSLLHELSDVEVRELVAYIEFRVRVVGPLLERDRWPFSAAEAVHAQGKCGA